MNRRCARSVADRRWQGVQRQPLHGSLQARHQLFGHAISRCPVAPQRWPAAGLDVHEPVLLLQAKVVLDVTVRDHDIANAQGWIEAARHAAQHQRATAEAVEQQGRGDAGIDLAGTRFDEHRLTAGPLGPRVVSLRFDDLRRMLEAIRDTGSSATPIYAVGGWARSDALLQLR